VVWKTNGHNSTRSPDLSTERDKGKNIFVLYQDYSEDSLHV